MEETEHGIEVGLIDLEREVTKLKDGGARVGVEEDLLEGAEGAEGLDGEAGEGEQCVGRVAIEDLAGLELDLYAAGQIPRAVQDNGQLRLELLLSALGCVGKTYEEEGLEAVDGGAERLSGRIGPEEVDHKAQLGIRALLRLGGLAFTAVALGIIVGDVAGEGLDFPFRSSFALDFDVLGDCI